MSEQLLDSDLVAASMRGDVRAFGRLVERHHGAVTAVAFATTRDLALSEDIAQDTFVAAWTQLGELRDAARVRAWLCNIARNKSKNELRGRKHEVAVAADAIDDKPSVIEAAVAREAEAQLRTVLADLPVAYREPLVLFYWQEQSIQSVASALEITEQAAQKRISRARGKVGDGLGERFDEAGRARRSAKAAAASVVAVLAMRPAPVTAAVTKASLGTAAVKLIAIVVACAGAGLGVWYQVAAPGASASPSAAAKQTAAAQPAGSSSARAVPPVLTTTDRDRSATTPADGEPRGGFGAPSAYEVTEIAATTVAVNLAGGPSSNTLFRDPDPPTFDRHVRGRVLDANGKPVAGAAVVVGTSLRVWFGSLTGDGGASTNAHGVFDVTVHVDSAVSAIALHPAAGWSAPVVIPAGRGDAEISIRVPGRGGLSGTVRRGGNAIDATVSVQGEGTLVVGLDTDARGHFELPLLAPGRYQVKAHATQLFAGGTSQGVKRDVVIESGKPTKVHLELPAGVLVVVTLRDAAKFRTVEYFLVPGQVSLDFDGLRALARSGKALDFLLGGQDVDRPAQLHDVAPGDHTLCVDRRIDRDHPLPLLCKKLTVPSDKPMIEVEVASP